ncbi:MAG: MFS transporter [Victivallales bacterium]|nr:MFS transporter [Victivallales bacterium]
MSSRVKLEFHRYDYAAFITFFAYASSSVIVPVALIQIASSLGFPLAEGGMGAGGALQLSRTISMTTLMVVSGFISAKLGLRKSLGLAAFVMGFGCLCVSLSNSYWLMFAALLCAGCGEGYIEAMATPFVQKLHKENTGQYMNFAHSFWSIGVTGTTIGAGFMLMCGVPWRPVVFCACLLAVVAGLFLLWPEKKGREFPEEHEAVSFATVVKQTKDIWATPKFWLFFLLMFIAGGAEFCMTFWIASFMQLTMKTGAFLGGLATAVFSLGMVTGRMGWGVYVPQKRLGQSLIVACAIGMLLSCSIPFIQPDMAIGRIGTLILMFVLDYLIGITIAPLWPTIQTYSVDRLPKHLDETMVFVWLSCAGVPGCGIFSWLMGVLGDVFHSLSMPFFLLPASQLLLTLVLLAETRRGGHAST